MTAAKAKPVGRTSAWSRRSATAYEDDAEQALKEIVAARGKVDQATIDRGKTFATETGEKSSINNDWRFQSKLQVGTARRRESSAVVGV
jgi:hypothetical protein